MIRALGILVMVFLFATFARTIKTIQNEASKRTLTTEEQINVDKAIAIGIKGNLVVAIGIVLVVTSYGIF